MEDIQEKITRFLVGVDSAWRFLRMGDEKQAHDAARTAERYFDELRRMCGKDGVSFEWVGNLIVGLKSTEVAK